MHQIIASAATNMLDIRLSGFLTPADLVGVESKIGALIDTGKLRAGYLVLGDISACSIQSQGIMAGLAMMIARMPKAQRIAFIPGTAMVNLQLARLMNQPYLRVVTDRAAALAWLTRGQEPAIAA